jgi:hypothetical protein
VLISGSRAINAAIRTSENTLGKIGFLRHDDGRASNVFVAVVVIGLSGYDAATRLAGRLLGALLELVNKLASLQQEIET